MTNLARLLLVAALSLAAFPAVAQPADYPNRPPVVVVPYPPGGGTDIVGRFIMKQVEAAIGKPIVIDNRGGANGMVGAAHASRAAPDGYTLLMGATAPNGINPGDFEVPKVPESWKLDPVAFVAVGPSLLLARVETGITDGASFRAWIAKQQSVPYCSDGNGSVAHLQMAQLLYGKTKGINVPYRGAGPAMQGFLSGDSQVMFSPAPVAIAQIASGRFVVVAQTGDKRLSSLPKVPTMREAGFEGEYPAGLWWGLFAPAGTPSAIKEKWAAAVRAVLLRPETVEWMTKNGVMPAPPNGTPASFASFVEREQKRWKSIATDIVGI